MRQRFVVLSLIAAAALAAMVELLRDENRQPPALTSMPPPMLDNSVSGSSGAITPNPLEDLQAQLILVLGQYRDHIDDLAVQVQLVELRDYLLGVAPMQGAQLFREAVYAVFPEQAASIFAAIQAIDDYNAWLFQEAGRMASMNEVERDQLLWQKRRELFGDAAEQIWSEELLAYEQRRSTIRNTITELNSATDITNAEKLHQLQSSLNDLYNFALDGVYLNPNLVSGVFLGMDSVQSELAALPATERQAQIDTYRKQMGYSETALERARELDARRNARWENGHRYMAEREALAAEYEGEEFDSKLADLHEAYFKHEAPTIAAEENGGFFRYLRPRVYGRN